MDQRNLNLNILLVEDDDVDVMTLRRAFKKNQILAPLCVARNGLEALKILRGEDHERDFPDARRLILLDLNMPKMGGLEFLEIIRKDPEFASIPVVILTTSSEDCDRQAAYKFNVAGYLIKPVQFGNFVDMVHKLSDYWSLNTFP